MPGFIGVPELLVLLVVMLLIFGPKRLPGMGRSLGQSMREFKDSVGGLGERHEQPAPPAATELSTAASPPAERVAQPSSSATDGPQGA